MTALSSIWFRIQRNLFHILNLILPKKHDTTKEPLLSTCLADYSTIKNLLLAVY